MIFKIIYKKVSIKKLNVTTVIETKKRNKLTKQCLSLQKYYS